MYLLSVTQNAVKELQKENTDLKQRLDEEEIQHKGNTYQINVTYALKLHKRF